MPYEALAPWLFGVRILIIHIRDGACSPHSGQAHAEVGDLDVVGMCRMTAQARPLAF